MRYRKLTRRRLKPDNTLFGGICFIAGIVVANYLQLRNKTTELANEHEKEITTIELTETAKNCYS